MTAAGAGATPQEPFVFRTPAQQAYADAAPDTLIDNLAVLIDASEDHWSTRFADTTSEAALRAQALGGLAARPDLTHEQFTRLLPLIDCTSHATITALMDNSAFTQHHDLVEVLLAGLDGDAAFVLSQSTETDTPWLPHLVLAINAGLSDYASVVADFWNRFPSNRLDDAITLLLTSGPDPLIAPTALTAPQTPHMGEPTLRTPTNISARSQDALISAPMPSAARTALVEHLCHRAVHELDRLPGSDRGPQTTRRRTPTSPPTMDLLGVINGPAFSRLFRVLSRTDLTAEDQQRLGEVMAAVDARMPDFVDPANAYRPPNTFTTKEHGYEVAGAVLHMIAPLARHLGAVFWDRLLTLPRLGNAAIRWRGAGAIATHAGHAAIAAHPVALLTDSIGRTIFWSDDTLADALAALTTDHPLLAEVWDETQWEEAYSVLTYGGLNGRLTAHGWQSLYDHLTDPDTGPAARYGWSPTLIAQILAPNRALEFSDRSHERRIHTYAAWASTATNPHLRVRAVHELWDINQIPLVARDPSEVVRLALLRTHFVTAITKARSSGDGTDAPSATTAARQAHALICRTLAADPSAHVRATLAAHDHTTPEALDLLSHDAEIPTRLTVATHPNADEATLRNMLNDPEPAVVSAVSARYLDVLGAQT